MSISRTSSDEEGSLLRPLSLSIVAWRGRLDGDWVAVGSAGKLTRPAAAKAVGKWS